MKTSFDLTDRRLNLLSAVRAASTRTFVRGLAGVALLAPMFELPVQAGTILWTSPTGSAWLTAANWGGTVPTALDVAQFATNPTGSTAAAGINFNSTTNAGTQSIGQRIEDVGAIEIAASRTNNLTIGNSSTSVGANGTLRLTGVTVNAVNNVVIANNATGNLTIQNTSGSGTQLMSVVLANVADNIVSIAGAGGVTINSVVKDGTAASHLTLTAAGTGMLTLSAANLYTGGTTVGTGQMRVTNTTGSATGTAAVTVGNNTGTAILSGTGRIGGTVTTATTGANVAHIAPGANLGTTLIGAAGTLQLNGGLSIGTGSTLDFDLASDLVAASDLITLGGSTLSLGSAFTINYNLFSPGLLATTGNYTLLSGAANNVDLSTITITSMNLGTYTPVYSMSGGSLLVSFSSVNAPTPNYFDTNGSVAGIGIDGGTAVWDATTLNWNPVSAGTGTAKVFESAQTVYFGASGSGTAGTVTVDAGGVSANNGIVFSTTGYTIAGGAITMGGATPTVTVENVGDLATISATLSGSTGLTKSGPGTLALEGPNDFTGTVKVNAGTLSVGSDGNLGASTNALTFAGGTLKTTAGIISARNLTITAAAGGGTVDTNSFDSETSGSTAINAAFTKSGTGNLSLNGVVTFGSGAALTVSAGKLVLGQAFGTVTMFGGATLNGDLLLKHGIRLNLNGAYTGTGQIQVEASLTTLGNTGSGITATVGNDIVLNSSSAAGAFVANIGATQGNAMILNGVISGASDVNFAIGSAGGAGVVTLGAANTYTGATTISTAIAGVVRLGVSNALPVTTALTFGVGSADVGALDLAGFNQTVTSLDAQTSGSANGIANTRTTLSTLTITGSATTAFKGVIGTPTNVSNLTPLGANLDNIALVLSAAHTGALTLTAANTYSGGTTINGGVLGVTSDAALGSGVVLINNLATLQAANSFTTTTRALTLGGGGGKIDTNGQDVTFGAGSTITGGVGDVLEKTGDGKLTLAGTQAYRKLVTTAGTTEVQSALFGGAAVEANAATKFTTAQTLSSLTIGPGAVLTFGNGPLPDGPGLAAHAIVPEPASLGLFALGGLALLSRRRVR